MINLILIIPSGSVPSMTSWTLSRTPYIETIGVPWVLPIHPVLNRCVLVSPDPPHFELVCHPLRSEPDSKVRILKTRDGVSQQL